jgi:CBS domain-containing protein
MFDNHAIHHVIVLDGEDVVGVVTPRDIEVLGFGTDLDPELPLGKLADHLHSARDAMSGWPVCIGQDQPLVRAAELLSTGAYHALPVLGADRSLVGIITSTDLVAYLHVKLQSGELS